MTEPIFAGQVMVSERDGQGAVALRPNKKAELFSQTSPFFAV